MPFLAPIAAAVVGAVTAVATAVSAVAANAALALGASAALADGISAVAFTVASTGIEVGALMGASAILKPHLNVGGGGMQTAFKADPQAGVPYIIGRTGTAGNIVFGDVAGTKNQDLTYVAVLGAGGPYQGYDGFTVDNTAVAFDGSGAATTSPFVGFMWQKTQLGASGASALTVSGPSIPPEWGSAEKLSGKAAVLWSLRYDTTVYAAGTPKPLWVVKGAKLYDPRLDSTYPGGSGSQRAATPSTWAYSENPYLAALSWCLGVYENGKRIMGVGAPVAAIDVAAFVEGANVADANAWKTGGVIYSTDDKWDVLTSMLQAGGGVPLKLGARISCFVNTPRVSLATLTAKDVVGDVSVTATQPRRTRINKVWPSFREESAGWEMTPTADPIVVSAYVTADGEERSRRVDYQLVQDATQVAQLARYDIENSREFGPITLPCKPRWIGYKPGDCITVTEPEYGLNGQLVLIVDRQIDPATMMVTLTCRSETTGKHAFALGQTGTPPPTPGITGVDPNLVGTPGAVWTMTGSSFIGSGELPALIIDGAVDDPLVSEIIVDWRERLTVTPTWGPWSTKSFPASATRLVVSGVKDNTFYGAQVRYKTVRGVEDFSAGFDLGVVETGAVHIADEGLLATLDTIQDEQLAAGVGVNCLVDTQFTQGSNWWRPDGDSAHTDSYPVSANGVCWAKVVNAGATVGQQIRFGSDNQVNSLPIKPGDYIEVQAVVGGQGCSTIALEARWLDAAGHNIGGVPLVTTVQSVSSFGAGGGEIDSGTHIGGFAQAPAGAYRVMFVVVGTLSGGSAWIFVTAPMLAKAKSGSTVLSQFNQGFLGQPGADVTSGHTAAAISGQGALATLNNVTFNTATATGFGTFAGHSVFFQSSAPTSGMVSGDLWYKTGVTPRQVYQYDQSSATWVTASPQVAADLIYASGVTIESLKPAQASADVTASHTAAAISGQGSLATLNNVTYNTATATGFGTFAGQNVYFQSSAPVSGMVSGDLWYKTGVTPRQVYQYDQSSATWVNASPQVAADLIYASGVTIESLKPAQASADVTSSHTASAISGQGSLATLNNAPWSTNISGRPTELTDGRITTALNSSGVLQTNLTTALANASNLMRFTSGGLFSGELTADTTSSHTASAISGQGSLATLSALTTAIANASNLMRYTSGGLFSGELTADTTGSHTAAAFTGQTPWATLAQFDPGFGHNVGGAGTRTVAAPLSAASSTQINVGAFTFYYPNATGTQASTSITGLTASTAYSVLENAHTGAVTAQSGSGQGYFDDATMTWIFHGVQATPNGGGTVYPTPTVVSGGGGAKSGWASTNFF